MIFYVALYYFLSVVNQIFEEDGDYDTSRHI